MPSRRTVLRALPVVLTGLAGCTQMNAESTPTPAPTEPTFSNDLTDPPYRQLRHSEGEPALRSSAHSPPSGWESARWVVTSPEKRNALDFSSEANGTEEARQFLRDTDFSTETVLVHQYRLDGCVGRQLDRVRWTESEDGPDGTFTVQLEYTMSDRDCQRDDAEDVEATLVRIPAEIAQLGEFRALTT